MTNPTPATISETAMVHLITSTFENVDVLSANGNSFFYLGPFDKETNMWPFATLVTSDAYDQASNLNRTGVYRLNIGISKPTFLELFGSPVPRPGADGLIDTGYDSTALDQIMPHPIYGNMFWVCVLSPSIGTLKKVHPLMAEAYEMMAQKQEKRTIAE